MQYYNIKLQSIIAKPASGCVLHNETAVWSGLLSRSYMTMCYQVYMPLQIK